MILYILIWKEYLTARKNNIHKIFQKAGKIFLRLRKLFIIDLNSTHELYNITQQL